MKRWLFGWMAILVGMCTVVSANTEVIYPADEVKGDPRFAHALAIVSMALEKTTPRYGPYTLKPSAEGMNETRYLLELEAGVRVNVAWSSTSDTKERTYIPIRICIHKGLLGYRIALIRKSQQARFDAVKTLDDLRALTVGKGRGWGDIAVYKANDVTVVEAGYDGLFSMIEAGRFDFFDRGITEIMDEYAQRQSAHPGIAIESGLLLHYPWPFYIFVSKKHPKVAERIEAGMRQMLDDGSFDALFRKHHAAAIEKANLKGRRLIELANPLLPKATPLKDARLWFDPKRGF